jgi:SP family sugar:H+ symporter-like MFS transporter
MNLVVKGTASLSTDASWMIPFGLFYFVPLVVVIGSRFIPESPRWLVQKVKWTFASIMAQLTS